MRKSGSSVSAAHDGARQRVRRFVERRGAVRRQVENEGAGISAPDRGGTEPVSVLKSLRARPLGRTLALWIIVGALWISLGMIVSATLVTVAFLT